MARAAWICSVDSIVLYSLPLALPHSCTRSAGERCTLVYLATRQPNWERVLTNRLSAVSHWLHSSQSEVVSPTWICVAVP